MKNKTLQLIILVVIAIVVSLATHFLVLNFSGIENKRTLVVVPVLIAVFIVRQPKISLVRQGLGVSAAAIAAELVNLFL
jgi:hypothetical protein